MRKLFDNSFLVAKKEKKKDLKSKGHRGCPP
jgi:hypothetical protein